jgi:hypothetical protein
MLSAVAQVRGVNLRPHRPWRATTRWVIKTEAIKIDYVEEGNKESISYMEHSVIASILSAVAGVRGVDLRPYRPRRATTLPVYTPGEINVYHSEEGNEESISHIEHSVVALILNVVARLRGVNLRPYRPRRATTLPVHTTGEINVYHVEESNE